MPATSLVGRSRLYVKIWLLYWTVSINVVDSLPWFAKKPLMNLLFGQEIYSDLMKKDVLGLNRAGDL